MILRTVETNSNYTVFYSKNARLYIDHKPTSSDHSVLGQSQFWLWTVSSEAFNTAKNYQTRLEGDLAVLETHGMNTVKSMNLTVFYSTNFNIDFDRPNPFRAANFSLNLVREHVS